MPSLLAQAQEQAGTGLQCHKSLAGKLSGRITAKSKKNKKPLYVTDIRPGFVDTDMTKGEGKFRGAPVEKAPRQIVAAIESEKPLAYISRRWKSIAVLLKIIQERINRNM